MKKSRACFADGGQISKADQLIAEMNAKYGVSGNSQPAVAAQQTPQTQPKAQPQQQGITAGIVGILKGRQQQIDKASGYANGGLIEGIGTPTSDSIPARVRETGEEIAVSTKERIVSHEQDKLLQRLAKAMGFESVDAFFEAGTGKPVGPTIKGGKMAHSEGGKPAGWRLDNDPDAYAKAMQDTRNAMSIPSLSTNNSAANGGIYKDVGLPAISMGAGQAPTIYDNGGLPTKTDRVSGSLPVANAPKESNPLTDGVKPWYAGSSTADNRTGLEMERERRAEASSAGVLNDPVKSALQFGVIGQPDQKAVAAQSASQNYGNEGRTTRNDLSISSLSKSATNPPAQTIPSTSSGRNAQGIITADSIKSAEAERDAGTRTNLGTMNLAEQNERMAKSLGYAGTDDFNKQFRLRNDPVQQQAELAANGQAQSPSQRQNAEIDSQLKRGQLKQQGLIAGLQDKVLAGDKNSLASLQALTGKNPNADRYITVQGGEEIGPDGMSKIRRPSYVFDQQTGRRVQEDGKQSIAFGDFEKAYLAKRPGTKPEQIKADYEQLYGSR